MNFDFRIYSNVKLVPTSKLKKLINRHQNGVKEYQSLKLVKDIEFQMFIQLLCSYYSLPEHKLCISKAFAITTLFM